MSHHWRMIVVGVVAVCGILLVILGISGLRELMAVGKVPPESLGRQVGYTTVTLFVGQMLIVWCLVAGRAWARWVRSDMAGDEASAAEKN